MLKIVDQEEGDQAKNDELVSVIDYDVDDPQKRYLIYSKSANNLPIVTTTIDSLPCPDPSKTSLEPPTFYPLELDRAEICEDEYKGLSYDPRYILVGEEISLYDLQ